MPAINSLTGSVGLKLGPLLVETLLKHYLERPGADKDKAGPTYVQLREDELLYDEAFNVVKTFLDASTRHTVEELQGFSNARTPSPPWVHLVRLVVPMACCDEAAQHLIVALGGEEVCKRVVGGTKWWQVRGVRGVDAEWITSKKDWEAAKKRYHEQEQRKRQKSKGSDSGAAPVGEVPEGEEEDGTYRSDMDAMRCILYLHGGGYYFGSVDQERYALQRWARKINGRVFAINYRLAPQYPFPCAIQDSLAAYLYLIRPPPGASHAPVAPEHLVIAGDSAGGGLTLALLQVLRDAGLPLPAGAVAISPWCDLAHSFPSIHTNTDTDIIPRHGLTMHRPSTLWPPPSQELTRTVHSTLRSRIRGLARLDAKGPPGALPAVEHALFEGGIEPPVPGAAEAQAARPPVSGAGEEPTLPADGERVDVGATAPFPTATAASTPHATATSIPSAGPGREPHTIRMRAQDGSTLVIDSQIQLYTPNDLVTHPLVSSAMGYLGGLPPILFLIGDKEVLRDEGIYTAHKAANPAAYPIREEQREMYPALKGIEERYGPTQVHLQVYDDCPHIMPILFPFASPSKYCFRAMATFLKYVTGMALRPPPVPEPAPRTPPAESSSFAAQLRSIGFGPDVASDASHGRADRRASGIRGLLSRAMSTSAVMQSSPEPDAAGEGAARGPVHSDAPPEHAPAIVDGALRPPAKRASSLSVTSAARAVLRQASLRARGPRPDLPQLPSAISELSERSHASPSASSSAGAVPILEQEVFQTPATSPVPHVLPGASSSAVPVLEQEVFKTPATSPVLQPQTPPPTSPPHMFLTPPQQDGHLSSSPPASPISPPRTPLRVTSSYETSSSSVRADGPYSPLKKPSDSSDVAGPRFGNAAGPSEHRCAGDPAVYDELDGASPWGDGNMIRERVSIHGVIRPLEPRAALGALTLPPELIGVVSELAARRYIDGRTLFDHKFRTQIKQIQRVRQKNLARARKDTLKGLPTLQTMLFQDDDAERAQHGQSAGKDKHRAERPEKRREDARTLRDGLFAASAGSWTWAWALDEDERPPPSSIAARRDTDEARSLARIADSSEEQPMSANALWNVMLNFLTLNPEHAKKHEERHARESSASAASEKEDGVGGLPQRLKRKVTQHFRDRKISLRTSGPSTSEQR